VELAVPVLQWLRILAILLLWMAHQVSGLDLDPWQALQDLVHSLLLRVALAEVMADSISAVHQARTLFLQESVALQGIILP
jgi:hypothetical protein